MAGHKLVVGNLPCDITKQELQTVFQTYGELEHVQLNDDIDRATGLAWAFVFYAQRRSGDDAIQVLNDLYKIRADAARPIQVWWSGDDTGDVGDAGPGPGSAGAQVAVPATSSGCVVGQRPEDSGHKLFVGCLPLDVTEDELRMVFNTYGEVTHIVIMKPSPSSGLRAAFVFYARRESGDDAIKVLSGIYKIRADAAEPIQVKWGRDKEGQGNAGSVSEGSSGFKLFVGSLPSDITEEELRAVFGTYGEVTVVHLLSPANQTGNKAALIFYSKRESAEDAIKVLDGQYKIRQDMEQPILVKWGKDKTAQEKGAGKGGWDGGKSGWSAAAADPWGGWGCKGGAWDAAGKGPPAGVWDGGKGGGGAWDGGGKGQGAWDAAGKGGAWPFGGWGAWDGGWGAWAGKDKGAWGGKGWKGEGKMDAAPTGKLFVANLPQDTEDKALEYVFGAYGKVEKVHVMRDTVKNGRIAALVEFGSAADAETAIATLHEKYEIREGHGPILVRHAYNKPRSAPY